MRTVGPLPLRGQSPASEQMIGSERARAFGDLARHLYWLGRFYREGKPDRCVTDIRDIRDRDLPGVIWALERWGSGLLEVSVRAFQRRNAS